MSSEALTTPEIFGPEERNEDQDLATSEEFKPGALFAKGVKKAQAVEKKPRSSRTAGKTFQKQTKKRRTCTHKKPKGDEAEGWVARKKNKPKSGAESKLKTDNQDDAKSSEVGPRPGQKVVGQCVFHAVTTLQVTTRYHFGDSKPPGPTSREIHVPIFWVKPFSFSMTRPAIVPHRGDESATPSVTTSAPSADGDTDIWVVMPGLLMAAGRNYYSAGPRIREHYRHRFKWLQPLIPDIRTFDTCASVSDQQMLTRLNELGVHLGRPLYCGKWQFVLPALFSGKLLPRASAPHREKGDLCLPKLCAFLVPSFAGPSPLDPVSQARNPTRTRVKASAEPSAEETKSVADHKREEADVNEEQKTKLAESKSLSASRDHLSQQSDVDGDTDEDFVQKTALAISHGVKECFSLCAVPNTEFFLNYTDRAVGFCYKQMAKAKRLASKQQQKSIVPLDLTCDRTGCGPVALLSPPLVIPPVASPLLLSNPLVSPPLVSPHFVSPAASGLVSGVYIRQKLSEFRRAVV